MTFRMLKLNKRVQVGFRTTLAEVVTEVGSEFCLDLSPPSLSHNLSIYVSVLQEPEPYSKEEMRKVTERLQASNAETGGFKLIASGKVRR